MQSTVIQPETASAQIINLGREFDWEATGWSGEVDLAFMDRKGNTE